MNSPNKKRFILLLALFAFFQVAETPAQSLRSITQRVLKAGERLSKTERIVSTVNPRTEQFVSYLLRGGRRQNLSYLTRTLEKVRTDDGREILRVVQKYEDAGGVNVDTSEALLSNLLPVSYHSELATQTEKFDFLPGRVNGTVARKNGEMKNYDVALDEPVYNAVIMTELVQALPLSNNYAAGFRVYNPGKQFLTMNLLVTGSEKVRVADGKFIDAWVVKLDGGYAPVTYWVAKNTQELIKQKVAMKNDEEFWRVRIY